MQENAKKSDTTYYLLKLHFADEQSRRTVEEAWRIVKL